MKVTKLVHSCMLVEHEGKKALVDPGNYSWASGIDQDLAKDIDYVLITHPHPDHIDLTFANVIHELSPNAVWYVTDATKKLLVDIPAKLQTKSSFDDIRYVPSEHADLTHWNVCADHTSFVLFDKMLISGDCHTLTEMYGAEIFAAAVNGGPWGSIKSFLDMVASMETRPKKVIPLHDWHWNDQARTAFYSGLESSLATLGVEFIEINSGEPIEVS
jgi:L-ascorbate metabolism protein UlaG (beta-lactamase superfamily)